MKKLLTRSLIASALGLGALLTSCVDPYAQGYGSAEVNPYRPGYEVRTLPSGYRTETIRGTRYYSHNGHYYQSRSGRYVVVESPRRGPSNYTRPAPYSRPDRDGRWDGRDRGRGRDVIVRELPRGSRIVDYRGSRYYQVRDTYYQRRGPGYVIVDRPR